MSAMLSVRLTTVAAVAIAGLSAACGSPSVSSGATPSANSPSASATASPSVHFASRCSASHLTLTWAGPISEPTGQHTLSLTLTNTSDARCQLFGYPGVSFVDAAGHVLPLRIVWGGDQVVTSSPPVIVELPAGGTAYLIADKYRCDTTDLMSASSVRIIPPDDTSSLQLSILGNVGMDYCGPGDPGSVVYVSPVEPSFIAATSAH